MFANQRFLVKHNILIYFQQVGAELPVDSDDADSENKQENGSTLLFVFERG